MAVLSALLFTLALQVGLRIIDEGSGAPTALVCVAAFLAFAAPDVLARRRRRLSPPA